MNDRAEQQLPEKPQPPVVKCGRCEATGWRRYQPSGRLLRCVDCEGRGWLLGRTDG